MSREADASHSSPANETSSPVPNVSLASIRLKYPSFAVSDGTCKDILRHCDRFNKYAQFLDHDKAYEFAEVSEKAVKDDLADLHKIVIDALRAFHAKVGQLEQHVEKFSLDVAACHSPRWYRNLDDLTKLDGEEFHRTFDKMKTPDICDFAAYLRETLPEAAMKQRPECEWGYTSIKFANKLHALLERVLDSSKHNYSIAFRVFVTARARALHSRSKRAPGELAVDGQIYANRTIVWLLMQRDPEKPHDQYWDCAACWRELAHAWDPEYPDQNPKALLTLLELLRGEAESEIRSRTMIAINGRLPTELADLIIEFAMLAEEIPME